MYGHYIGHGKLFMGQTWHHVSVGEDLPYTVPQQLTGRLLAITVENEFSLTFGISRRASARPAACRC